MNDIIIPVRPGGVRVIGTGLEDFAYRIAAVMQTSGDGQLFDCKSPQGESANPTGVATQLDVIFNRKSLALLNADWGFNGRSSTIEEVRKMSLDLFVAVADSGGERTFLLHSCNPEIGRGDAPLPDIANFASMIVTNNGNVVNRVTGYRDLNTSVVVSTDKLGVILRYQGNEECEGYEGHEEIRVPAGVTVILPVR